MRYKMVVSTRSRIRIVLTFKNLYFHNKFLKHSRNDKVKMEEISRITLHVRKNKNALLKRILFLNTDYGRPVRKSPSLHG